MAGFWLVLLMGSHSLLASTTLLLLLGALAFCLVVVLRIFGFGRDHPWFQRAASRPWRDGRDVLRVALRHLPEVFIVTPNGSLLAPNAVELRMNPEDIESLAGTVGEFKKELQRRIWNEQHHQRQLAQFLLANGLIGRPDLERAIRLAAANEASGRTKVARERLNYRRKK